MSQDPVEQSLRETLWRRPLTAEETARLTAWLAAHPEARADWTAEAALSQAFARLPAPPVPSNFAARVMQAIEREDLAAARARLKTGQLGWLRSWVWVPRAAAAAVLLLAGALAWQHGQRVRETRALEKFVAASEATPLPPPEAFAEFDTIMRIMPGPTADVALLTLLK